jgi:hypothetical protein
MFGGEPSRNQSNGHSIVMFVTKGVHDHLIMLPVNEAECNPPIFVIIGLLLIK